LRRAAYYLRFILAVSVDRELTFINIQLKADPAIAGVITDDAKGWEEV
jgi:hypothetical protein